MPDRLTDSDSLSVEAFHEFFVVLVIEQLRLVDFEEGNVYLADFSLLSLVHLLDRVHLAHKGSEDVFQGELAKDAADLLVPDLHGRVVSDWIHPYLNLVRIDPNLAENWLLLPPFIIQIYIM